MPFYPLWENLKTLTNFSQQFIYNICTYLKFQLGILFKNCISSKSNFEISALVDSFAVLLVHSEELSLYVIYIMYLLPIWRFVYLCVCVCVWRIHFYYLHVHYIVKFLIKRKIFMNMMAIIINNFIKYLFIYNVWSWARAYESARVRAGLSRAHELFVIFNLTVKLSSEVPFTLITLTSIMTTNE